MTKILAIETSCDETACAIVHLANNGRVRPLSSVISTQIALHRKTQGVVPEVAARAHLRKIQVVVREALRKAGVSLRDIDHIAVTHGPGLATSLLTGAEFAKALSLATGKNIIPVNHMLGHLYSAFLENPKIPLPSINLIVSGGHTYIILLKNKKEFRIIGRTVDDAVGEAFDKIAKMLNLPYPGGPEISKLAEFGRMDYNFPRPMIHTNNFNFSFSGLKTAVLYKIRDEKIDLKKLQNKRNISFSFQNAAVEVLISKTIAAAKKYKAKSITLSGGVAANKKLRKDLNAAAKQNKLKFYVPEFHLCTDNALMIANAAAIKLQNGFKPIKPTALKVDPVLEFKRS